MSDQGGSILDCGCAVYFHACEAHLAALDSGDQTLHIEVEFAEKYTRSNHSKHIVDLERVQRIQLGLDDEPMDFNEQTLADMIQRVVDENPYHSQAFIMRALANALRGDDDHHRLHLRQKARGRWESPSDYRARHRRHTAWLIRLHRLRASGWQTDAAVHRIAETTGTSVSAVYAGIAENRAWQASFREGVDSLKALSAYAQIIRGRRSPK